MEPMKRAKPSPICPFGLDDLAAGMVLEGLVFRV